MIDMKRRYKTNRIYIIIILWVISVSGLLAILSPHYAKVEDVWAYSNHASVYGDFNLTIYNSYGMWDRNIDNVVMEYEGKNYTSSDFITVEEFVIREAIFVDNNLTQGEIKEIKYKGTIDCIVYMILDSSYAEIKKIYIDSNRRDCWNKNAIIFYPREQDKNTFPLREESGYSPLTGYPIE